MNSYDQSKPKLAVILSRFPYPLEKGDKLRAYYQIRELSNNFQLTLYALTEEKVTSEQKAALAPYCEEIHVFKLKKWMMLLQLFLALFGERPFQVAYFFDPILKIRMTRILSKQQPDHLYCQLIRASDYVKDYHHCHKTLDYMDALSKGIDRRIGKVPSLFRWLFRSEARRLRNYEQRIFTYFDNHTIISEQDRDLILHPKRKNIHCIANGIDRSFFNFKKKEPDHELVFVGNLSYAPNIEAVEEIDEIVRQIPGIRCFISGATPSAKVRRIVENNPQLTLNGWTDDIREAYVRGKIFFAPMMIGTGMQNKLLEAMALGLPCVTTPLAGNAIKGIHEQTLLMGENQTELIQCIHVLLQEPDSAKVIAQKGSQFVQENYSWKASVVELEKIFMNKQFGSR
jgi:glycosyltransferase involved in cell wall biosynthesis